MRGEKAKRFGFTQFRFIVAAIFLLAAGLKAWQLATVPPIGEGLLQARWFNILVVEFELIFGIWLLFGKLLKLTWLLSIGCFSIFAAVSLYKALSGEVSCGCFGAVVINPWVTMVFDLAIVGCLLLFRPSSSMLAVNAPKNNLESHWFLHTSLMTIVLILVTTVQIYLFFGSFIGLGDFMTSQEISIEIDKSFETEKTDVVGVFVTNRTDGRIRLVGVRTDCGCGKIEGVPVSIPPRSQAHVLFVADERVDRIEKAKQKQRIVFYVDGEGTRRGFAELPLFEFLVRR